MIIAGNWKMKMGFNQAAQFLSRWKSLINAEDKESFIFFPPACLAGLFQKEDFYWGGQNVCHKAEGAFTGETSAKALKEMGAGFGLLGHSERRRIFGESDADVEKKFSLLQELGLIPVLCLGESLADRFDKKKALSQQLSWLKSYKKYDRLPWKADLLPPAFKNVPLIAAYEPLWSIGSGETPSLKEAEETAQFIKESLPFSDLKVFYGGSLDEKSVKNFSGSAFIDGFLVGGASLDPDRLYSIYQQARG